MGALLQYLIPVLALMVLAAGWAALQLLAKRMQTKNHIDHGGGCCGACDHSSSCAKRDA